MKKEIWILNGARTPFGEYNGVLRGFSEIELGAVAARGALERAEVEPARCRARDLRQRDAEQPQCHLRRAPREPQGRHTGGHPLPDRESDLWLRDPVHRERLRSSWSSARPVRFLPVEWRV